MDGIRDMKVLNKKFKKARGQGGFTLIELVLTVIVIATAVVPLTRLTMTNTKGIARQVTTTRAIFLLREGAEIISSYYASQGYTATISNWSSISSMVGTVSDMPGFTRTATIDGETILNGVYLREVTITVTHSGGDISPVNLTVWVVKDGTV